MPQDKKFETVPDETAQTQSGASATPEAAPKEAEVKPDPFDLARLRVQPDYEADAAVKKLLTTVPIRKPHRQEWIWVHPSEDYRDVFWAISLKDENETYMAVPHIASEFQGEITRKMFYLVQNASRVSYLWPVKMAAPGERLDGWSISAHEAAERAMVERVRLVANRSLGAYETFTSDNTPVGFEPKWPDKTFQELIRIAFKGGRLIDSLEHPIIKQIRGL
jgi:uncharacterized protein YbdZ (MbtH family)